MRQSENGVLNSDDYEELERIMDVLDDILYGEAPDPDLLRFSGMFLLTLSRQIDALNTND